MYMARRRFFVDWIREGRAEIEGENAHHLTRVLRVQPGQSFEISDGGQAWVATVESAGKNRVCFVLVERVEESLATPPVNLYLALIKFDSFEWAIEKATELGIGRIVPVETARSDQGLFAGSAKRVERWRKIVREASEQSRRLAPPTVADSVRFANAVGRGAGTRIWLEERPGAVQLLDLIEGVEEVSLFVGPEGGWTDPERAALAEAGWAPAALGTLILRAETAVCAGLAIINAGRRRGSGQSEG